MTAERVGLLDDDDMGGGGALTWRSMETLGCCSIKTYFLVSLRVVICRSELG